MVVLYRTTGVLNLAFGAIGAFGALVAWELVNNHGWSQWPAYAACVLIGGAITLAYGVLFGPPLAGRDPLVKAVATRSSRLSPLWDCC
jgi:branched-chain amino acid transport system permease protein